MIQLVLLLVTTVGLFIFGFFPVSNSIIDINTDLPKSIDNQTFNVKELYHSHVNKTVLIVIDALRWDFVTPKLMPLTSSLIHSKGCVSRIQVESPTVTLPRIKALTTGNIPQYIDVVRNLASSEVLLDSWLHSSQKEDLKIVFYGDNTWEKLFPDIFTRSEGTTSFFVWDFTEVDDNVTRNVNIELHRDDWDIMILHYLGLDHIGHVLGPFSPRIVPKLQEMDEIIYKIHKTVSEKGQVVSFITGDHGMRDSGGHGGTTQPEVIVPLISLGIKCENSSFFQTDIPANIASLLGLHIPSTSIGNLQKSLLQGLSLNQYLYACYYNINLLLKKVKVTPQSCYDAEQTYKDFLRTGIVSFADESSKLFAECSGNLTNNLYDNSSKESVISLLLAMGIMLNLLLIFIYRLMVMPVTEFAFETVLYYCMIMIHTILDVYVISCLFIITLCILVGQNAVKSYQVLSCSLISNSLKMFSLLTVLLHPLSFISTSFIEEEHYYWIYFSVTLFIVLVTSSIKQSWDNLIHIFLVLTLIRFCMDLNSTVENSVQNTGNWYNFLNTSGNYLYHHFFFVCGLLSVYILSQCYFKVSIRHAGAYLRISTFVLIYLLKIFPNYVAVLGKLIWFLIFVQKILWKDCIVCSWVLVATLLMKTHNTVLISVALYTGVKVLCLIQNSDVPVKAVVIYTISNCFYFLQGHRNTLASVDVSVGYIGLSDYYPLLVTAQVVMHTYTFHILFHLITLQHLAKSHKQQNFWMCLLALRASVMFFTCLVTLIFRHHLFIWSVFAPKLIIESIHTLFLFLEITVWYCINYIKNYYTRLKSFKM